MISSQITPNLSSDGNHGCIYKARTKQRLVFFLASGHTGEDVLNMSMRRNFKQCFRAYHFMSLLIARPFLSPESVVSFDQVVRY